MLGKWSWNKKIWVRINNFIDVMKIWINILILLEICFFRGNFFFLSRKGNSNEVIVNGENNFINKILFFGFVS